MKKLYFLIFIALLFTSAKSAQAALTVGSTTITSDGLIALQGTSVAITGDTTLTGTLRIPIAETGMYAHMATSSVLSDLIRLSQFTFNMSPTATYNSYNLDDTSVLGTNISMGDFAGSPSFDFLWSPPGANPVSPDTIMRLSASSVASASSNGTLAIGSEANGAGTGGIILYGGSGIGYTLNTPGNVGAIYPHSASTIGIGFTGGFAARPTTAVVTIAASGVTVGTNVTLGPATSHLISSQTTAPTPSVTGAGYSGATLSSGSSDTKGKISATVGAGAGTLVVTFQTAYASAPVCTVSPATDTGQVDAGKVYVTSSTTALTLNFVASTTGGAETWNYICIQ
ncbi:MAG: hypothetical protein IT410_02680 [Candidatus Doudnabacteria bacterium]|nr:hypothetical protein [Candidatus Doudnabacteria bacterium]